MKKIIVLLVLLILFTGCSESSSPKTVTASRAKEMLKQEQTFLIDVRSKEEYNSGHIDGAISIPSTNIGQEIEEIVPNKKATIIVYCQSGARSKSSAQLLLNHGYENVYDLGSINNWEE